ncbi:uncharacterized protein LOC129724655 [Wyeomyia smithii]|uniref:uncharacterized protein LOC129724655 n=1 Tax=Wyeomyia smithii TaxID=174621 RepID=UPI002467FA92|nr:uncharacterized protein LOC129724655 [Wyeomyia smithii]XP_055535708.1 uncharacterized protein LOC129724655 [Wyeomyia smithii]
MPEQQISAEDRPSSSSSSEPLPQEQRLVENNDERSNNENGRDSHFVAIRNLMNRNRTGHRNGMRPPVATLPFERSFIPMPARYYPIVIPAEPTIEDLLRQAAGTAELYRVTEIKLKVISHMTSLQRIPFFIPNLRSLTLEGSIVTTLRDLGCDMTSLVYLNVSRCSLKNLDGTSGLETLEELVVDYNQIEEVGPCANLTMVKKISLKGNHITDLGSCTFLALCENLEVLDLRENFVSEHPSLRLTLKENIPQLRCLNEIPFSETVQEENCDLSSSEYRSSSSSNGQRDRRAQRWETDGIGDGTWNELPNRPVTGTHHERAVTVELLDDMRPATADATKIKNQLTSGEPLCGNVVTKARRVKRQRTAWGESTSCSSMSSSDSSYSKDFPDRLPQKPVDLELGVIGVQDQGERMANQAEDDSQSLLRESRLWRQRSLQTRESNRQYDQINRHVSES